MPLVASQARRHNAMLLAVALAVLAAPQMRAQARTIQVLAGGGATTPSPRLESGDNAQLDQPWGIAADAAGDVFIADSGHNLVEEVSAATGAIIVVAGGGTAQPGATPVNALRAQLNAPAGVAVDAAGNLYIADTQNNLIEKVSGGQIVAIAGGGTTQPSLTPEPASRAALNLPYGVAVDDAGDVYVADSGRVERVSASNGELTVVAGGGVTPPSSAPEAATRAAIGPYGLAVDAQGNLYIADTAHNAIDKVSTGQIAAVAGGGNIPPSARPAAALGASLNAPTGVVVDAAGNLYIADGDDRVEEVSAATGAIVTLAGGGATLPTFTPEITTAAVIHPTGVAVDAAGNVYVSDRDHNLVDKVVVIGP